MDAIQIIETDHRQLERLFDRFEQAARRGDERQQARIAREIVRELSVHAAIEEEVLYPALARAGAASERLDALEDHHAVKLSLAEVEAMTPRQERFAAKVRQVTKSARRHIEEEEATLLPHLAQALDQETLRRLGAELEEVKHLAPTRPHPAAPDVPPANLVANPAASLLDRLRDAASDSIDLLRGTLDRLISRSVRAGRDVAFRARRDGAGLLQHARDRGERALEEARMVGAEMAADAAGDGAELADRLEHRSAAAARELRGTSRAQARHGAPARGRRKPAGRRASGSSHRAGTATH